jgi:hypothetical protein
VSAVEFGLFITQSVDRLLKDTGVVSNLIGMMLEAEISLDAVIAFKHEEFERKNGDISRIDIDEETPIKKVSNDEDIEKPDRAIIKREVELDTAEELKSIEVNAYRHWKQLTANVSGSGEVATKSKKQEKKLKIPRNPLINIHCT